MFIFEEASNQNSVQPLGLINEKKQERELHIA
jgi:hypothetical protein